LDQVQEGRIGWSVEVEGNWQLHPDHAESPRHVAPDWEVPEFNPYRDDETFTVEGVEELIGDCEEAGIEVEGTVIEALEFMMVYEREAMICEDLWEEYEEDHEIKQLESEDLETTDSEAESEDDEEDDEDEDDEKFDCIMQVTEEGRKRSQVLMVDRTRKKAVFRNFSFVTSVLLAQVLRFSATEADS